MQVIVICIIVDIQIWLTPRLAIIIGNDTRRGTSPSCVSEVSSFILMISFPSSEVVRHVSQHELGTTFSRSGLFCNTTTTHPSKFDVHVTVHRDKFLKIKPTRWTDFSNLFLEWNSTCFRQFLCLPSRVFHCTHSNGTCHTVLLKAC